MITKQSLLEERKKLGNQREIAKQNFHQLTGAISLIDSQLKELAWGEKDDDTNAPTEPGDRTTSQGGSA